jgi:hypothetical protein
MTSSLRQCSSSWATGPAAGWHRPPDELDRFVVENSVQTEKSPTRKCGSRLPLRTTLRWIKPKDFHEILSSTTSTSWGDTGWRKVLAELVVHTGDDRGHFRLDRWTKGYDVAAARGRDAVARLGGLLLLP